MTIATITAAIRTKFGTDIEDAEPVPVLYDNQDDGENIPTEGLWVRLSILYGDTNVVATSGTTRRYRTFGNVVAQCFKPAGEGEGDLLDLADAIVTAFRGIEIASPAITFYAPSLSAGLRDGSWWQRNVTIPFRADEYA